MEFSEFREKFGISQDKLHKLTLEAHELYIQQREEMEDFEIEPEEYEFDPGSAREEYLDGFLQLLMEEEDD